MSADKMEKETKVATEDPKIDLFEDDDEFEEFEINEGNYSGSFFCVLFFISEFYYCMTLCTL